MYAAITNYDGTLQLNPDHADALLERARAYLRLGNNDRAIADCQPGRATAPELRRRLLRARHRLLPPAQLRAMHCRYERGAAPQVGFQFEAYQQRGVTYATLRQFDRAVIDFGEAMRLRPAYQLAFYERGLACGPYGAGRSRPG